MRALVMPTNPRQQANEVELVARVGNNKIKVRLGAGTYYAVDRFRLHCLEKERGVARARIAERDLDALPWQGAGDDPVAAMKEADTARDLEVAPLEAQS